MVIICWRSRLFFKVIEGARKSTLIQPTNRGLIAAHGHLRNATIDKSDLFFSDVMKDSSFEEGCVPIYDLQAVATSFVEQKAPSVKGWKALGGVFKLNKDMFIAQVVGKSMEPTIKDGSWCLFRPDQGGTRNGKIVLVESRKISDPETQASYTIKRYHSEKEDLDGFRWWPMAT